MILSLNFLRDYIDIDKDIDIKELAEKMTSLGNEYDFAGNLLGGDKLVIGEVIECENHPDSDHLHVCKVNIGDEILQIVCGAKNVRKGLKVIVALVGCKLPEIEIKKSTIRGVDSCGMLCSMLELGLDSKFADDVDKVGIHELPEDAPVGNNPLEYMGFDDKIIDFELTSNRGDLLSVLGMAYEVASVYGNEVKLPNMNYDESGNDINDDFKVNINTDNCKLFLAKRVNNVNIHESNQKIKERLIASGIRPINNVVDISNYVMMELGQPLHFYDADKLKNVLEVRMAKDNEKLVTLDNVERVLSSDDIVISDGDRAIGLAGVMGGIDTEVTAETKNIIIEAAIFDNVKVRKTSNKILRSEASNRFEKGLDPNRTYMAIDRACNLLQEFADGNVNTGMVVYDKTDKSNKVIDITVDNINNILGASISETEIVEIFNKLGFKAEILDNLLRVSVPTRRIDISIKEDLIEEV
nr:phenylalanine--tRNA ligase subunit beta [Clostridiales bacterium]